jgi:Endoribonuclease L-PSP
MAGVERSLAIHHVNIPGYPAAHSPYSHAVVANGFVVVSGQIPVRPGGGPTEIVGDTMQEQTRQALRNVQTILKAAGSSLDRVLKVTVLLALCRSGRSGIATSGRIQTRLRNGNDAGEDIRSWQWQVER